MSNRKFILTSGSIFFILILLSSYFFMYSTFGTALKFSLAATLIFVPVNFLLNKLLNKKVFEKGE